ncbi:MAG: glycosyltransferase family 4 protein [Proteobacteria bacterium]|nr:glycosyltransferase family 4 protein [Pseudomonadota bacterium]
MAAERGVATDGKSLHVMELGTLLGVGGITRHMVALTGHLRARGHRVTFAGSPDAWVNGATEADFLDLPIFQVSSGGGGLPRRLWATARAAIRLRRWLRTHRVDLMHAHDSAPALVANLARKGLGVPLIVTYHGSEPERVAGFGRIARACDLVVTPSHRSAEDLASLGGVPPDRLKVLGLGVDPPPAVADDRISALRHRLLGDGERLIVTIARLTRQKGIDILIDCVARLKETRPGWRFALAGDGFEEAELKALAERRGVLGHLTFLGRTSEPHLLLRAADLFLLTSRWEALPFTIVEAFQAGCPAVATACSGVVELIDDRVGRVVSVGDVPAICAAVEEVLADEGRRRAMAAAALARAGEERFDPGWVHPQFERLYREVVRC